MAKYIVTNVSVVYNTVDLSDHVESAEITMEHETVDITSMGASARQWANGLRDDTITLNFFQDFASAKVHATISPLLGVDAGAVMVVKPVATAVSSTNPAFTATVICPSYTPLSGTVGDSSQTSIEFKCAAGSSIVVSTT